MHLIGLFHFCFSCLWASAVNMVWIFVCFFYCGFSQTLIGMHLLLSGNSVLFCVIVQYFAVRVLSRNILICVLCLTKSCMAKNVNLIWYCFNWITSGMCSLFCAWVKLKSNYKYLQFCANFKFTCLFYQLVPDIKKEWCIFPRKSAGVPRRDVACGWFFLVGVHAVSSMQCTNTVDVRKDIWPVKITLISLWGNQL